LAGLLVLIGQSIARVCKRAHLAEETGGAIRAPSRWDWGLVGLSVAVLGAFTAALTVLRENFGSALAKALGMATASNATQLTVPAPSHTAPGWVIAILALVAPLIAIVSEYHQYDPRAHRLRRSLRLYAWNSRKLRWSLYRAGRVVHRARRALLAYDN